MSASHCSPDEAESCNPLPRLPRTRRLARRAVIVSLLVMASAATFVVLRRGESNRETWTGPNDAVFWIDPVHCQDAKPEFAKAFGLRMDIHVPRAIPAYNAVRQIDALPSSAVLTAYSLGPYRLWFDAETTDFVYVTKDSEGRRYVFLYGAGACI